MTDRYAAGSRCILHADMDAFFASVEQRDRPALRGRPVAVGGTSRRGVIAAASYEARRFGVHSAMSTVEAQRLCPELVLLRGEMARYARESRRIFTIFREFSPRVEGLSLDEAFLDLGGTERLLGPAAAVGERLRARVREQTGLAVSVGIAPVKMVAKIASAEAKPDGLMEVKADALRAFLAPLPLRRIWGVGAVAERRLLAIGLRTVGDLAAADDARLRSLLGEWGVGLAQLARGRDLRELEPRREAVSYSEENTFGEDLCVAGGGRRQIEAVILAHAESVARRLRRDAVRGRTVVLKWREGRRRQPGPRGYPLHTRQATLPEATDDGGEIARVARRLLLRSGPREAVRLIGVGVCKLEPARARQLSLFERASGGVRNEALNRALDEISERYGSDAVVRAGQESAERAGLSLQIKRGEGSRRDSPD